MESRDGDMVADARVAVLAAVLLDLAAFFAAGAAGDLRPVDVDLVLGGAPLVFAARVLAEVFEALFLAAVLTLVAFAALAGFAAFAVFAVAVFFVLMAGPSVRAMQQTEWLVEAHLLVTEVHLAQ